MTIARIRPLWRSGLAVLLLAAAFVAPVWLVRAQENPMAAPTFPVEDDEPEAARPQPTIGPSASDRFTTVIAPQPPTRPWPAPAGEAATQPQSAPAAGTAPQTQPETEVAAPATPSTALVPVDAPLPPRRPGAAPVVEAATPEPQEAAPRLPTIAGPDIDFPLSIEPDMRVAFAPAIALPSTTAEIEAEEERTPEPTFVEKQTDAVDIACIKPEVMSLIRAAGENFGGTPIITSGQRNRGRSGSFHRKCMAADFFVPGIERARLAKYLRGLPGAGGVGTYCHTKSVHIDIGEPRNWSQCGRRFRFAQR